MTIAAKNRKHVIKKNPEVKEKNSAKSLIRKADSLFEEAEWERQSCFDFIVRSKLTEAADLYEKVQKNAKHYFDSYSNLALTYFRLGNICIREHGPKGEQEAEGYFRKALKTIEQWKKLEPLLADCLEARIHTRLAYVFLIQKKKMEAFEEHNRAIDCAQTYLNQPEERMEAGDKKRMHEILIENLWHSAPVCYLKEQDEKALEYFELILKEFKEQRILFVRFIDIYYLLLSKTYDYLARLAKRSKKQELQARVEEYQILKERFEQKAFKIFKMKDPDPYALWAQDFPSEQE